MISRCWLSIVSSHTTSNTELRPPTPRCWRIPATEKFSSRGLILRDFARSEVPRTGPAVTPLDREKQSAQSTSPMGRKENGERASILGCLFVKVIATVARLGQKWGVAATNRATASNYSTPDQTPPHLVWRVRDLLGVPQMGRRTPDRSLTAPA